MKVDYSPRSSGKTTRMIKHLFEDDKAVLITFSRKEVARLIRVIAEQPLWKRENDLFPPESRIFWWEDYIKRSPSQRLEKDRIYIDNADYLLDNIFGGYIREVSITKDEIRL